MASKTQRGFLRWLNPKNIDFLGTELQLNYTKNGRFQTKLGGFISLTVVIFVSLVVYSSFKNLLSTDSPVATVSTVYTRDSPRFDLVKEKIFYHFAFAKEGRNLFSKDEKSIIDRFVTIKGFLYQDVGVKPSGQRDVRYPFEIVYKPCSEVVDQTVFEDVRQLEESYQLLQLFGLCPELSGGLDKYFVDSKIQDPPSYNIHIYVFPCSLPNSADCASAAEFNGTQLYTTNTRKGFDASNYTNPLYTIVEFDGLEQIDPQNSKIIYHKVRDNEVWDDTRDFFEKRLRAKSADYFVDYRDSRTRDISKLHCDANILNVPLQTDCQPYISFVFSSGGEKRIIVRTYSKFFNTLGEIGGTAEIFFIFAFLVYFRYNIFYRQKYIRREAYQEESISKLNHSVLKRKRGGIIKNGPTSSSDVFKENEKLFRQQSKPIFRRNEAQISGIDQSSKSKVLRRTDMNKNRINKLLKKQTEENMSGISLFKSLNEIKILRKMFFKPRHKKLIPMVLLNMKSEELDEEENEGRRPMSKNQNEANEFDKDISIREALDQLTEKSSKTIEEKMMDSFILEYLPGSPDTHQQIQQKPPPPPPPLPFKFDFEEDKGDQFSEIQSSREGHSEPDSPRLSVKSPGFSRRSISSNNPLSRSRPRLQKKMSIFSPKKKKRLVGTKKIMIKRNMMQGSSTRHLKK